MAFASDIVLSDNAAANKTFSLFNSTGTDSGRIDTSTALPEPRLMLIKHSREGKSGDVSERLRHLVTFEHQERDVTTGKIVRATLNCTIAMPVNTAAITRTELDHLIAFIRNFLGTSTNVDRLLRNEP